MKYDNPTKQTWRGWAWNQLQSRIPKQSTVMVLAGDAAADLEHARRRKFKCVAVDVDMKCVDTFRAAGGVAVQDKIHRQLMLINPDAAILDMLGGITPESWGNVMVSAQSCRAVVWNGLRGRDIGAGTTARRLASQKCPDYSTGRLSLTDYGLHRGKLAFSALVGFYWMATNKRIGELFVSASNYRGPAAIEVPQWFELEMASILRPAYSSYRSKDSNQYFDSIAWTNLCGMREHLIGNGWGNLANTKKCNKSKRKAAAAKALLTMGRGA